MELQGFSAKLCLAITRAFLKPPLKRFGFRTASITRFESTENYIRERVSDVENFRELFWQFCPFGGKTVLELGCNRGYLLDSFLKSANFDAIGADIDPQALALARSSYGDRIQFIESTPTSIPLPDNSVDVIYAIDTVEHLSRPLEIFTDAYRVLRPGASFLIHWHPWLGPYGSHLEDIVPFPWPQVVFSMDTLLTVAAKLYDSPDYVPACYWFDSITGERRPNPYLDRRKWDEYLNHLTIAQFKRVLRRLPYKVIHFQRIGFGGKTFALARYLQGLAHVPGVDEFFTRAVFCVLQKV